MSDETPTVPEAPGVVDAQTLIGGTGFMPTQKRSSKDTPRRDRSDNEATKRRPKVAVIGGGPGGMFTTYILNQKVPEAVVTIFEASDRLGGKICTDEFTDGTPFEAGVAELYEYLGPGGKDPMRQIIENDLGLETVDMFGGPVVLDNKILRDDEDIERELGEPTLTEIKDFHKLMSELMPLERYANRWQPDNSHPWANDTFRHHLREAIPENCDAIAYIETAVHSDLATEPHTCNGLNAIKNVLMDNDEYMQVYHVVGGISKFAEALRKKLKATVRLNTRVRCIGKEPEQWRNVERDGQVYAYTEVYNKEKERYTLKFRDESGDTVTENFDAVFVAVPNHWLTQIHFDGHKLCEGIHRILAHYDLPAHYLRVSLLYDTPWWNKYRMGTDFWMMDCFSGCCCYDESHRWRADAKSGHVLSLLLAGQDALLLCSNNQDDEDVVEYVLDGLPEFMRAEARSQLHEAQVDRFVGSINAQPGGWPSKDLRTEHQPEPEDHPELYIVGDYLFDSTLNAALISANTAVDLFVECLGIEPGEVTSGVDALAPDDDKALALQLPPGAKESPHPPGPDWKMVKEGPRGGKYWLPPAGAQTAQPPTQQQPDPATARWANANVPKTQPAAPSRPSSQSQPAASAEPPASQAIYESPGSGHGTTNPGAKRPRLKAEEAAVQAAEHEWLKVWDRPDPSPEKNKAYLGILEAKANAASAYLKHGHRQQAIDLLLDDIEGGQDWLKKRGGDHSRAAVIINKLREDITAAGMAEREGPEKGREEIEHKMGTGTISGQKRLGGGANGSYTAHIGGVKAVWKPSVEESPYLRTGVPGGEYYKREAAAYSVAKAIGLDHLVPVTVTHTHERDDGSPYGPETLVGSAQQWVPDAQTALSHDNPYDGDEDRDLAAAFDYLIGNTDRHHGNWMVGSDGKIKLIDNGLAFPNNGLNEFRSSIFDESRSKDATVPAAIAHWDQDAILAAVDAHGITGPARDDIVQRLDSLKGMAGRGKFTYLPIASWVAPAKSGGPSIGAPPKGPLGGPISSFHPPDLSTNPPSSVLELGSSAVVEPPHAGKVRGANSNAPTKPPHAKKYASDLPTVFSIEED